MENKKPIRALAVFDTDAFEAFTLGGPQGVKKFLAEKGDWTTIAEIVYDTEAELDAYCQGVEDAGVPWLLVRDCTPEYQVYREWADR